VAIETRTLYGGPKEIGWYAGSSVASGEIVGYVLVLWVDYQVNFGPLRPEQWPRGADVRRSAAFRAGLGHQTHRHTAHRALQGHSDQNAPAL